MEKFNGTNSSARHHIVYLLLCHLTLCILLCCVRETPVDLCNASRTQGGSRLESQALGSLVPLLVFLRSTLECLSFRRGSQTRSLGPKRISWRSALTALTQTPALRVATQAIFPLSSHLPSLWLWCCGHSLLNESLFFSLQFGHTLNYLIK